MSKKLDHYEVSSNQVVGLLVGYCITRFVSIPFAGKLDPDLLSLGVTTLFFIVSYSRTYSFRRLFRYLEKKKVEKLEGLKIEKKNNENTNNTNYTGSDWVI